MFIGDGAKLVRDAFALAKEKAPAIIFIDEIVSVVLLSLQEEFGRREEGASPSLGRCHALCEQELSLQSRLVH
jgi:hypothetical protein